MNIIYVTSNADGTGKTTLSTALLAKLRAEGKNADYVKLFSQAPDTDKDTAFATMLLGMTEPTSPVPQKPGSITNPDLSEWIKDTIIPWAGKLDVAIVEGPNLTPDDLTGDNLSVKLSEQLNARVVLLLGYNRDITLDNLASMMAPFDTHLAGLVVNGAPKYHCRGIRQLVMSATSDLHLGFQGVIPEDRCLMAVTLAQITDHLGGRFLNGQDKATRLVESFLIGGNIMDSGETYFGRSNSKAVIARGDRPDIQLAALRTTSVALILTGNHEPVEYVSHEVVTQSTPLIVVPKDTKETSEALDTIFSRSTAHHLDKVRRFQELLEYHCGLSDILTLSE
ncbi:phosphotransacetylase family protein [SAR202 cluster bacterium AD-804-J14_MRT_500m]|nr:phosphotransacetylase family protein [SAR202 cluster bacterium AD-804-J14_MRT_500m]